MPNKPTVVELMKDHYDNHFRSVNYLLVAHGAGLVGCLSVLRDYAATPQLKGVGLLILLFAVGLLGSILHYVGLFFVRAVVMNAIMDEAEPNEPTRIFLAVVHLSGLVVALLALIAAIVVIIFRFASL